MAIVTLSNQGNIFETFSQTIRMFSHHLTLGAGGANSTAPLNQSNPDTYRIALRMPSIGLLNRVTVNYKILSGSPPGATVSFRLYGSPWGSGREANDLIYSKTNIALGTNWDHVFSDKPIPYSNRVALTGETFSRNFLWMEVQPSTGSDSIALVDLYFEV